MGRDGGAKHHHPLLASSLIPPWRDTGDTNAGTLQQGQAASAPVSGKTCSPRTRSVIQQAEPVQGHRSPGFAASRSPAEPLPLCVCPAAAASPRSALPAPLLAPALPALHQAHAIPVPAAHRARSKAGNPQGRRLRGRSPKPIPALRQLRCCRPLLLTHEIAARHQGGLGRSRTQTRRLRAPGWLRASLLLLPRWEGRAALPAARLEKAEPREAAATQPGPGLEQDARAALSHAGTPTHARLPFGTAASEQSPSRAAPFLETSVLTRASSVTNN